MAKNPTPQQALEAARLAQAARMDAVRVLADARQAATDVRDQTTRDVEAAKATAAGKVAAAEAADVKAWDAALRAGWQAVELRRIGFAETATRARVRRRRPSSSTSPTTPTAGDVGEAPALEPASDVVGLPALEPSPAPVIEPVPEPAGAHHD